MGDIFPKILSFKFTDILGDKVSNLIFYCKFKTNKKNDYSFGPFVSDINGKAELVKDYIEANIFQYKQDFPMDYSDNLSDCLSLELLIESENELKKRIAILKEFYPDNAKILNELIARSYNLNLEFKIKIVINLPIDKNLINITIS